MVIVQRYQSSTGRVSPLSFQVLCLSPTYELALQTGEVASKMSQFAPELTIRYAVKGEEIPRGSKITDHIIIGTPGKVSGCYVYHVPLSTLGVKFLYFFFTVLYIVLL